MKNDHFHKEIQISVEQVDLEDQINNTEIIKKKKNDDGGEEKKVSEFMANEKVVGKKEGKDLVNDGQEEKN